ncbi:MAG: BamA/TamA family outer membrane protein, partial [Steroidobacteraceae bacterium]
RKVADRLSQLSLPPEEYAALRKRQQVATVPNLAPVDEIRFEGLTRVNPQTAQAVMQTEVGKPLVQAQIDADMRRIYGMGDLEHVNYNLLEEPGKRVMVVEAVEKAWGPNYLRLGLGLSSDFSGATHFSLLASHRMTWLNSLGAEFRTDAQVGFNNTLRLEFYQPLNPRGQYFVAPHAQVGQDRVDLYSGEERVAVYNIGSSTVGLDLGVVFRQFGQLRFGVEAGKVSPKLSSGVGVVDPGDDRVSQGGFRARLIFDQVDNVNFPRHGWSANVEAYNSSTDLGADAGYTTWRANAGAAYTFGENTVRLNLAGAGKLGSNPLPAYAQFQWGGFLRQSGYASGQLFGSSMQFGELVYFRRIIRGDLLEGAFAGGSLEVGNYGTPLVPGNTSGLLKSMSLFVGADSPLGPVYLGYGRAADGADSFYFFLGRPY